MMKRILGILCALMMICAFAQAETAAFQVTSPTGAPGVALAILAVENPEAYHYVAADTIAAEFAAANADFLIAPVNAGAKLFKAGKSTYRLAAVVTWGNLYFATQRPDFQLEDLKDCTLTLFGESTINASIALYALSAAGIEPKAVEYLAGAANTQTLLLTDPEAVVMTAEPALSAAKIKAENISSWPVNELYEKATGYNGFTQAGLFVSAAAAENRADDVKAFLLQAKEAVEKCTTDIPAVAEAAVQLELLPNVKVAEQAIPGCAIRWTDAADAREQVEATAQIDLSQFGGELPADAFYYAAE